jgi:hypothetical protein
MMVGVGVSWRVGVVTAVIVNTSAGDGREVTSPADVIDSVAVMVWLVVNG